MAKRLEDRIKGVFTWFKDQITSYPYLLMTTIGVLLVGYLLIVRLGLRALDWADWTGLGPHISPDNSYYRPAKTLWDFLDLLIIPMVLAIGAWALNKTEREAEREAAEKRAKTDRKIARDQQRQATLQAYYDRMTELLLKEKLLNSSEDEPVRTVARTITLATLRGLDKERKGQLVQFLYKANLLNGILHLEGADLSKANLWQANLNGVNLYRVDLSRADLSGADLNGAILSEAYFVWTNLSGADLVETDLRGAVLRDADLRSANLSKACLSGSDLIEANLSGANLSGADLHEAILWNADLSGADLSRADLRRSSLSRADWSRADLSGAKLRLATYSADTQWPEGFDPIAAEVILVDETVELEEDTA